MAFRLAACFCVAQSAVAASGNGKPATNFVAKLAPASPFGNLEAAARAKRISLKEIDRPAETNELVPGDSVTTLVTLHERRSQLTQWLICFQAVANPESSSSNPPPLVLYTSTGNKLEFVRSRAQMQIRTVGPFTQSSSGWEHASVKDESARVAVNQSFLSLGLDRATAALARLNLDRQQTGAEKLHFSVGPNPFSSTQIIQGKEMASLLKITPAEERALAGGLPALFSYFNTVQQTPDLESILRKVLSTPSIWAIAKALVKDGGIAPRLAIGSPRERVGPVSLPGWNLPSNPQLYSFPIEVTICGHHALTLTLIVTAARPPLLACGGIVGFLAENPEDKENFLTFRVISAHCASSNEEAQQKSP